MAFFRQNVTEFLKIIRNKIVVRQIIRQKKTRKVPGKKKKHRQAERKAQPAVRFGQSGNFKSCLTYKTSLIKFEETLNLFILVCQDNSYLEILNFSNTLYGVLKHRYGFDDIGCFKKYFTRF